MDSVQGQPKTKVLHTRGNGSSGPRSEDQRPSPIGAPGQRPKVSQRLKSSTIGAQGQRPKVSQRLKTSTKGHQTASKVRQRLKYYTDRGNGTASKVSQRLKTSTKGHRTASKVRQRLKSSAPEAMDSVPRSQTKVLREGQLADRHRLLSFWNIMTKPFVL